MRLTLKEIHDLLECVHCDLQESIALTTDAKYNPKLVECVTKQWDAMAAIEYIRDDIAEDLGLYINNK